jgi:hypothetical protein
MYREVSGFCKQIIQSLSFMKPDVLIAEKLLVPQIQGPEEKPDDF